ncbi:MAG TPA: FAD-dependent oxidoreductase [Solirubrobacteraceae bacterium]|jgi:sulfide:quinone oxidoreductase
MPPDSARVVIAGGGVAGLEACLALRSVLDESQLAIDLLCPEARFEYRPLAVLEPFDGAPAWSMGLDTFAADQSTRLVREALKAIDPERRLAIPARGEPLPYDALVVCVGARPVRAIPGAITFRGSRDAGVLRDALAAIDPGRRATIAFAAPQGAFWTLPLYELAILAAAWLRSRARRARILLAVPEATPLEAFGARASAAVGELLAAHGIEFRGGARPVAADAGELELDDGERIATDTVIALPALRGRHIDGLPQDAEGFVAVDDHGRVEGLDDVYAAGDMTTFPLKQGGLATQQADAAADQILAGLGLPIVPQPFEGVLRGVIYTDREPSYLREDTTPQSWSMWWPPSKIAGRHLAPYLAVRAGAPRAPEVRPDVGVLPVSIDVRAVASALSGEIPPG